MKSWKLITTILQNWIDDGAKSYEEAKALYDNRVASPSAPDQTKSTPKGSSKKLILQSGVTQTIKIKQLQRK